MNFKKTINLGHHWSGLSLYIRGLSNLPKILFLTKELSIKYSEKYPVQIEKETVWQNTRIGIKCHSMQLQALEVLNVVSQVEFSVLFLQ